MKWWELVRDIALTGTAIFLCVSQVFARSPNPYILGTGLALTTPAAALAIRGVLSAGTGTGTGGGLSSPPAPDAGPSRQGHGSEG